MNKKFKDVNAAEDIQSLLNYDGIEFIYSLYRTFLRRDPDQNGLEHFLGRILNGESKINVTLDVIKSEEASHLGISIKGQDEFVKSGLLKRVKNFTVGILKQNPVDSLTKDSINEATGSKIAVSNAYQQKINKILSNHKKANSDMKTIWFDLTTSMCWHGGVVGIVRAELEIAAGLYKLDKSIRFSMLKGDVFEEIPISELDWLFSAENVADAYIQIFRKERETNGTGNHYNQIVTIPNQQDQPLYPYQNADVVFSAGWIDSNKEEIFSQVKLSAPSIYLGYLVYDTILANEDTSCFYQKEHQINFIKYLKWVSSVCDFVLYGGQTAQLDTFKLQQKMCWSSPQGSAIQFGTDIAKNLYDVNEQDILLKHGINGPFIMTVGTLEPRKNHDTLYKAYLMALQIDSASLPQLVICGRPMDSVKDLVDSLDRDPRIKGKVIKLTPTDLELAVLYRNCLFTVLPSVYEGWSLTLPESLGQGKFCLASDTPPLKEIGKDMIDYASPFDVKEWAEKILFYSKNNKELQAFEGKIKKNWKETKWLDTSKQILTNIEDFYKNKGQNHSTPEIWLDISISFLYWDGGVSGIIRSELTFAKYLYELSPNAHFFAWSHNRYFEVKPDMLEWLFNSNDLATDYKWFHDFWSHHELHGTGNRNVFSAGVPADDDPRVLQKFPDNSVVLFTCIDWDQSRIKAAVEMRNKGKNILVSQLIYDMTPFLVPHLHAPATCEGYKPFIEFVSMNFDYLIYGGQTAMRNSIQIQKEHGWLNPTCDYIEFGSDIRAGRASNLDREILTKYGVSDKFILTVGTIEPRKNHETLYKAYLLMLSKDKEIELPMLVIVGKKGWKSDDFMNVFQLDDRVKNKIIMVSPSDTELDVLYRNCLFTLLPSFYEGWSLTLPESLSYGKFCLTSKVDPLIETGRDLVEYIDPLDTAEWGRRIHFYFHNLPLVSEKEQYIQKNWEPKSWKQSTKWLIELVNKAHKEKYTES